MKVVGLGEVMMRLSTPIDSQIVNSKQLDTYFGGGEYNTLVNLAGLGHETSIVTTLPDNQLTTRILTEAKAYGVDTSNINITDGRLGTYYALLGDEITPTEVIYDRAESAFANSTIADYDFKSILQGADLFHVSGITAALTTKTKDMTIAAIKQAKDLGIKVSYDSNYRAKLWTQDEAGQFLEEVLPLIDYAFLGILDLKFLLKYDVNDLEEGYQLLSDKYPNIKVIASTNRTVVSPNEHNLSVNLYTNNTLYQTEEVAIKVKDRIGGGDVFTAGILDGILLAKEQQQIADFGLADATIKHYRYGDNCFISREQVESVLSGSSLKINR